MRIKIPAHRDIVSRSLNDGGSIKMLRRDFMAGASAISLTKAPKSGVTSINDALLILEKAVRREIAGISEIRVSVEADERKRIALLFSVIRRPPTA